jgi:hypothetical protein
MTWTSSSLARIFRSRAVRRRGVAPSHDTTQPPACRAAVVVASALLRAGSLQSRHTPAHKSLCPSLTAADDVLRGIEPLCTCGRAAVRIAGGEAALAARLRSTPPATPGQVMTWQHDGKGLSCVHAGGDTGWGIVGQHGEQPWCLTCSSRQRSCEHVAVLGGGAAAASGPLASWLAPADFEARLNEDFDRETGQRRLTCLSREPLPARPEDDLELDALLAGEQVWRRGWLWQPASPHPVPSLTSRPLPPHAHLHSAQGRSPPAADGRRAGSACMPGVRWLCLGRAGGPAMPHVPADASHHGAV